jgi:hypothetical protein
MDAALAKCADQSLSIAIVEQFVAAVGSEDPLAVTVKADGRLVLIPRPRSPEEALDIVREHVGHAVVRVGVTQFPAGVGVADVTQLQPTLFDACENMRTGTELFAKVGRIVTKWYGRPTNKELLPQMLDDAIYAWKSGSFEGTRIFTAEDPGGPTFFGVSSGERARPDVQPNAQEPEKDLQTEKPHSAEESGMRIDLSRIGGK